jgi:uncharacterized repeat protein (TIGR01451 family)
VGVPNGGSAPFVATITPTGNPGDLVVCQIYGVDAQNPDNNDTSLINKTIVSGITGWQQIPDEPNLGRMDNVTSGYNGFAWSITGYGGDANVRYYDPAVNAWTVVANSAMPFGSNYTRSGCTAGDTVFMYGDASTVGYTGLWSYNMATNVWAQVTPSGTPPAQTGIWAPAWVYDLASGYCFMTGGASTPGGGNLTTTYVYDPMSNTWLNPLPNFTTNRAFHAAFIYDRPADSHHLLCVAGGVDANSVVYTSTQCFDFMTGVWNAENVDMGSMPSTGHGLWGVGYADKWHLDNEHQLWIVDGADSAFAIANMTYYFDVNTGTWVDGDPLPSGGVYRTSAVTVNNDIFHLGGSTGGFSYTGLADHHLQLVCPPTMTNPVVVEFDAIANACPATVDNMAVINDPAIPAPVEVTASTDVVCSQTFTMEKLAPTTAFTGDVIPYTINLDFSELVGTAVLTDVIPAGVQFADNLTATAGTAMYDPGTNAVYWTYDMNPPLAQPEAVLWDNGPLVTHPGGGFGGADASALQSALGLTIYGFGHQYLSNNHMADDFVIADPGGWNINQIEFFAYQTGAPTNPSPLTAVYYQIWNGPPDDPGSSIVFGDLVTNRLVNSTFSNIYRALDTDLLNNQRAIFVDTVSAGVTLPPGTYWIEWTTDGSGAYSGPWAPPISILGQTSTGNAKQNLAGTWAEALDGTSPQGMPFIIEGTGGGPNPTHVTISFDVLVTSQGNPNPVVNTANLSWMGMYGSASASTAILTPSITLAKTVSTDGSCGVSNDISVPRFSDVTYCYTVENTGNVDLNVHDLFDDVLGQLFTGFGYTLTPGASTSYLTTTQVTTDTFNTATWTAWADDIHFAEATASANVDTLEADLVTTKTGPVSVRVGEPITYTINVANLGPDDATDVVVVDTLPTGATFVSAPDFCNYASGVVTCNIDLIASGWNSNFEIVITMGVPGGITNTVTATAYEYDPTPGDNTDTWDTEVLPATFNFYLPIINKH